MRCSASWRGSRPRRRFVFAGGQQRELMTRATAPSCSSRRARLVGSAPLALESAVTRACAALIDASPADLSIGVAGVPPRDAVIGWDAATAFNQPIAEVLAPHHLSSSDVATAGAVAAGSRTRWPARPRASPRRSRGSRRRYTCFAAIDVTGAGRDMIAAVPVRS